MSATLTQNHTTPEAPATIELELTNEGDRRDVKPHGQMCDPFNRWLGKSEPAGLWVYETTERPEERLDECWSIPDGSPRAFPAYACMSATMEAEATRTWTYELWDDAAVEGYYPTGEYRFETQVSVGGSDGRAAEWWLDLRVSEPDT